MSSIPVSHQFGPLHFALQWQEGFGASVDIDLNAVTYNEKGEFLDCCYFNKLSVDNNAIALSQDAKRGQAGADVEALSIHPFAMAPQVKYVFIIVICRSGADALVNATLRVSDGGAAGGRFLSNIPLMYQAPNTAALVAAIYPPTIMLQYLNIPGPHRDFKASLGLIEHYLHYNVNPELLSQRSPNDPTQSFSLVKLESYFLDPSVDDLTLGLGWDKVGEEGTNLDAVCLVMDEWYQTLARVSRGGSYAGGAIRHSGDDQTGAGGGDDEKIRMRLGQLPAEAKYLALFIDGLSNGKIGRNHVRLVNNKSRTELCRYDLDGSLFRQNAQLMVCFTRIDAQRWQLLPLDEEARTVSYMPLVRSTRPDLMEKIHVEITPIRGRGMAVKDEKKGTSDPYCRIKFFDGSSDKNDKIKHTLDPDWDTGKPTSKFDGPIAKLLVRIAAKIDVFDYDKWSFNDFMGRVKLHLGHVLASRNRGPQELTLPVEQQHEGESKEISGTITFTFECHSI